MLPAFNSKQLGVSLPSGPLNVGMKRKSLQIAKALEQEVTRVADGVFREVAPFLGQQADLASQLPILGLSHWHPLSLDYVKAKGSAVFFVYSSLRSARPRGRTAHEILHGPNRGDLLAQEHGRTLIDTLGELSGTRVFGPASVEVRDWRKLPVTGSPSPAPPDWKQVRFTLLVKPWGKLRKADLPRFERWLVAQGAISDETRIKLTNPAGVQRALLRPWFAWFSDVIIPGAILEALRAKYPNVTLAQIQPFDPGPF
jgi:hypothetical protein